MNKMIKDGELFKATNTTTNETFYTNSSIVILEKCGMSYPAFYMNIKGATKQSKGWTFSIVKENSIEDTSLIIRRMANKHIKQKKKVNQNDSEDHQTLNGD